MTMKDLEALGWKADADLGHTKNFKAGPVTFMVSMCYRDDVGFIVSIYRNGEVISVPFETLDQAVAFANSAACCTPDNPKGRWVE